MYLIKYLLFNLSSGYLGPMIMMIRYYLLTELNQCVHLCHSPRFVSQHFTQSSMWNPFRIGFFYSAWEFKNAFSEKGLVTKVLNCLKYMKNSSVRLFKNLKTLTVPNIFCQSVSRSRECEPKKRLGNSCFHR